jgi:hypothetical protein
VPPSDPRFPGSLRQTKRELQLPTFFEEFGRLGYSAQLEQVAYKSLADAEAALSQESWSFEAEAALAAYADHLVLEDWHQVYDDPTQPCLSQLPSCLPSPTKTFPLPPSASDL